VENEFPVPLASKIARLSRWLAIAAVCFGTAEVFVRVEEKVTWGAPLVGPYDHDHLLVQDSLGFRGRPHYRYEKWGMNGLGFRGPEIARYPMPGVARIAIAGASETFGLYERAGGEYPSRMQQVLDSIAPGRFEIVNVALPGMSLSSMISYFRRAVLPARPRALLIYPTPAFYLEVDPLPEEYVPPRLMPPPIHHLGRWVIEGDLVHLRLADKSRDILKELIPTSVVTAVREWRLARARAAHGPEWVWSDVPADRMAIMRRHLERLVSSIQATGVQVILVTHTNRFIGAKADTLGPDRRHLINLISTNYPRASMGVLIDVDSVANGIIRQVAAAHGAMVIEVQGKLPPGAEYFADYTHFTDAGADAMARILARGVVNLDGAREAAPASNSTKSALPAENSHAPVGAPRR
jgi:hypothetical protein